MFIIRDVWYLAVYQTRIPGSILNDSSKIGQRYDQGQQVRLHGFIDMSIGSRVIVGSPRAQLTYLSKNLNYVSVLNDIGTIKQLFPTTTSEIYLCLHILI